MALTPKQRQANRRAAMAAQGKKTTRTRVRRRTATRTRKARCRTVGKRRSKADQQGRNCAANT